MGLYRKDYLTYTSRASFEQRHLRKAVGGTREISDTCVGVGDPFN
jgi:hypothetical protein